MGLMRRYESSVVINAAVHRVWAVTCDIESLPSWSPTMTSVTRTDSGPLTLGSKARVRQPKLLPATWVVDELDEDRTFSWHTDGPGYRMTAVHVMEPTPAGTSVRLGVEMTGALSSVLWVLAGRMGRGYVDQEAAALKRHCEGSG
jgi:uncharacterized membrane protein